MVRAHFRFFFLLDFVETRALVHRGILSALIFCSEYEYTTGTLKDTHIEQLRETRYATPDDVAYACVSAFARLCLHIYRAWRCSVLWRTFEKARPLLSSAL